MKTKTLPNNKNINSGAGLVMEIEVGSLPNETRMALSQIWNYPQVFSVAQFKTTLQRMLKLYSGDVMNVLAEIDTTGFEYVSFVKSIELPVRSRCLLVGSKPQLECVRTTFGKYLRGEKVHKPERGKVEKAFSELTEVTFGAKAATAAAVAAAKI